MFKKEFQTESATMVEEASNLQLSSSESDTDNSKKLNAGNKVQMSKAQKRRMWDRTDASKLGQLVRFYFAYAILFILIESFYILFP